MDVIRSSVNPYQADKPLFDFPNKLCYLVTMPKVLAKSNNRFISYTWDTTHEIYVYTKRCYTLMAAVQVKFLQSEVYLQGGLIKL